MKCPYCGHEITIADIINKELEIKKAIEKEYEVWHPSLNNAGSITWLPPAWTVTWKPNSDYVFDY